MGASDKQQITNTQQATINHQWPTTAAATTNKNTNQPTNHNMNNKNNKQHERHEQQSVLILPWILATAHATLLPWSDLQHDYATHPGSTQVPHEPGTASHFWFGAIFSNPKKDVGRVFSHLISAKLMLEQSPYKIEGWCDTYPMLQMESGPGGKNHLRTVTPSNPKNSGATEHSHVRACDRTQPGNLRIRGCWDVEEKEQKISIGFVWCTSFNLVRKFMVIRSTVIKSTSTRSSRPLHRGFCLVHPYFGSSSDWIFENSFPTITGFVEKVEI